MYRSGRRLIAAVALLGLVAASVLTSGPSSAPDPAAVLVFKYRWAQADTAYVVVHLADVPVGSPGARPSSAHRSQAYRTYILQADLAAGTFVVTDTHTSVAVQAEAGGAASLTTEAGTVPLPPDVGVLLVELASGFASSTFTEALPPNVAEQPGASTWYALDFEPAPSVPMATYVLLGNRGGELRRVVAFAEDAAQPIVLDSQLLADATVLVADLDVPLEPGWNAPAIGERMALPKRVQELHSPSIPAFEEFPFHERELLSPFEWVGEFHAPGLPLPGPWSPNDEAFDDSDSRGAFAAAYAPLCADGAGIYQEGWRNRWVLPAAAQSGLDPSSTCLGLVTATTIVNIADEDVEGCVSVSTRLQDGDGVVLNPEQSRDYCGGGRHQDSWSLPFKPGMVSGDLWLEMDIEADYTCDADGERALQWSYYLDGPSDPSAVQPDCQLDGSGPEPTCEDFRCGPTHVAICHALPSGDHESACIPSREVGAHIGHGDICGGCVL